MASQIDTARGIADELREHIEHLNKILRRAAEADVSVKIWSDVQPALPGKSVNLFTMHSSIALII